MHLIYEKLSVLMLLGTIYMFKQVVSYTKSQSLFLFPDISGEEPILLSNKLHSYELNIASLGEKCVLLSNSNCEKCTYTQLLLYTYFMCKKF